MNKMKRNYKKRNYLEQGFSIITLILVILIIFICFIIYSSLTGTDTSSSIDYQNYFEEELTSTNNVDLKTAQIVLNPLHDILHFDLGPVPIMDIKGKGGINLHVLGTRKNDLNAKCGGAIKTSPHFFTFHIISVRETYLCLDSKPNANGCRSVTSTTRFSSTQGSLGRASSRREGTNGQSAQTI